MSDAGSLFRTNLQRLLDDDGRDYIDIAVDAWPDIERTSARRRLDKLRSGQRRATQASIDALSRALGCPPSSFYEA